VALCGAGGAAVAGQRAAAAADAAALAAADSASGAVAGVPCEQAARLASAGGAELSACDIDGLMATVSVGLGYGSFEVSASSRAGPPD
jgi:secretion/DNA translocation related TadE-like protein